MGGARLELTTRRLDTRRPPALLLGGLNLVRSLGLAGIPTVVASWDPGNLARHSRYRSGWLLLPPLEGDGRATAAALAEAGDELRRRCGRRVPLLYGSDDGLRLLYGHTELLSQSFLFLTNPAELGRALLEKDRFAGLMAARGIPVPRTFNWNGYGDDDVRFADCPVIIKPKHKINWHGSQVFLELFGGTGKGKVYATGPELLADARARALADQLLIQEYIDGGDEDLVSFHGLFDERGAPLATFAGRKIRTWPARAGESAFIELVHDPALLEFGRHVVDELQLRGPCKIDVKRRPRDGRMYVLEINARFTLWNYLAAVNGLNVPAIAYDYLVDDRRPTQTDRYRTTYRWLEPYSDWHAFRELHASGELDPLDWLRSLLVAPTVQDVFAWTDPRPFVVDCLRFARERVKRWQPTAS